ncbi:MAG: hypothetical protein ACKVS9_14595 [Phycisphaerae bacterium]
MLYAALTFWIIVIVFAAWGVHTLWSDMVKPRVVNAVLLPGTLVAQLGHVLGLLITGNSVQNTTLMGDDERGEPQSETPEQSRVPVVGPILTGLLPLVACCGCLYMAAYWWGGSVLSGMMQQAAVQVPQVLPTTLPAVWELLRTLITVSETMLNSIIRADLANWSTVLFLYLAVCLTVRMTPMEGNRRGALAAIFFAGLIVALLASFSPRVQTFLQSSWPILSFAVGMLLFLLMVSLVVRGVVGLARVLARNE